MLFLIQTVFDLYIVVVLLRLLLQLVNANFYNPVSQLIVKLTNPVLQPIQRFVSGFTAPLLLLLILQIIKYVLLWTFATSAMPGILVLLAAIVLDSVYQLAQLYFYMVIIVVLMSWINPTARHPVTELLEQLTEPLLERARRIIPVLGGFDLSPLLVLIGLKIIMHFVRFL